MSRHRMPRPAVDLADPASVATWGAAVHDKLDALVPLVSDATQRRRYRHTGRRRLRHVMTRLLRDLHVMLDALAPRPGVLPVRRRDAGASCSPAPADDAPPWETGSPPARIGGEGPVA